MLDQVCIFDKSGVVLWSKTMSKLKGSPVNDLIKSVLLEERGGSASVTTDWYKLQWTLANELDFVVVVVYQKMLQLAYVDELLTRIKRDFIKRFWPPPPQTSDGDKVQFDLHFARILKEAATRAYTKKPAISAKPTPAAASPAVAVTNRGAGSGGKNEVDADQVPGENDGDAAEDNVELSPEDEIAVARERLRQARSKGARKGATSGGGGAKGAAVTAGIGDAGDGGGDKKSKKPTVWHDADAKGMTKKQRAALDKSKAGDGAEASEESPAMQEMKKTYMPAAGEKAAWQEDEEDGDVGLGSDDDAGGGAGAGDASGGGWGIGSFLRDITGNKLLTAEELAPVLEQMRQQLMVKNVASEIAEDICQSVRATLEGKRLGSFTRVKTAVRGALKESILRVLTPKTSTDVLRQVLAARGRGKPFSIVFVGINGVGKSTSLAKVAYYLKQHGVRVMIAACDTFRSGAVEQLRVHATCLDVPLFERGYAKDAAVVARAALAAAADQGCDCVLVDTAGRMQNNEPLMRSLSKLVADNEPDLVLFVGEALVGNDCIDQLQMFNRALADFGRLGGGGGSSGGERPGSGFGGSGGGGGFSGPRQIDGIVLTKFDTVDTKVGAALSMSFKTGQPVVFVGTGQKYTHLRRLNVNFVLKALFS